MDISMYIHTYTYIYIYIYLSLSLSLYIYIYIPEGRRGCRMVKRSSGLSPSAMALLPADARCRRHHVLLLDATVSAE